MSITIGVNSYGSVSDAREYIETYTPSYLSDWDGLSTAQKESALKRGARYLDNQFGQRLKGRKTDSEQLMSFPRSGIHDESGNLYDMNDIPLEVAYANFEMSARIASGINPDSDIEGDGRIRSEKVKVGPIEINEEYEIGAIKGTTYPIIDKLMAPFLYSRYTMKMNRG